MELACDVLVVGAGCGGVAAALAATDLGRLVVLTEAGSWLGGQLTSQAVPPDEHPWVESTGITARYRQLRDAVRTRYKRTRRLTEKAMRDPLLNPGAAWVSNLSGEPVVFREALGDLVRPAQARGLLRCLLRHRPLEAVMEGDLVAAVRFENLESGEQLTITARYVLDATEEGDVLPLTGCESVMGAESATSTGELHAVDGPADPRDQQAITWCAALEWRPGEDHTSDRPAGYDFWRNYRADFWPGPQLGWTTQEPETGKPLNRPLFSGAGEQDLWTFRRIRYGGHYADDVSDVTLVNWPQVDYWLTPLIGVPGEERRSSVAKARELSLCFVHWLQTDAPRPDGGSGYPGLRLCPAGSTPGGAGYARWSGGGGVRSGKPPDRRRVHRFGNSRRGRGPPRRRSRRSFPGHRRRRLLSDRPPSQHVRAWVSRHRDLPVPDPVGCLAPAETEQPSSCRQMPRRHVTHITNGCYRLHPAEWNVGEAAGALVAFCLEHRVSPRDVRNTPNTLADFQRTLVSVGIQLRWPEEIQTMVR